MAQKIRDDKIGALSHSAGNILMAATNALPAYLTIGGQQYKITSQLSVALPAMTANGRYQIYAVQSAGVVSLAISSNENSAGPSGYLGWKLLGSLTADGSSAFLSFNSIKSPAATFQAAVSRSENTNYQAEVDGFFVGRLAGTTSVSAVVKWDVFSDSTPTPSTVITSCYGTGHSAAQFWNNAATGFMIPVKKGNYYRATKTDVVGTQGVSVIYNWIPSANTVLTPIEDL